MGSRRIQGITIEIGGDASKLNQSLKSVDSQISKTKSSLRDVDRLLKFSPGNTELLTQKQKQLTTAIASTKARLAELKSVSRDSVGSNAEWDALQREIVATEQDLERLQGEYRNFGSVASQQVAAVGNKFKDIGGKISDVGKSMSTYVTAPIVATGAASVAAWKEVDAAMDTVVSKTGATGSALETMQQSVSNIAKSIPTSFENAGVAIGEVNTRFGITGQELENLSTKFIQFAELNNTDVNSSIDTVQNALNAFGLSANDAGPLLDTMNKVGQDTGISMDSLGQLMVSNATAFQGLGLNAASAAHLLGKLEKSGIDTSVVMTGLTRVQKSAMENGVSMEQALTQALSSSTSAIDIFGAKAGPKLYASFQNGTLSVNDFINSSHNLDDALGSVSGTYEETLDPLDKVTISMNKLKDIGADIVNSSAPMLADVMERIGNVINRVAKAWDGLSDGQKEMAVKVALLVAAVGPLLLIVGQLITGIGMFMTFAPVVGGAIAAVVGSFAPFIAIGAAVVAAGVLVYKNWDTIQAKATQLATAIKTKFTEIKNVVTVVCKALVVVAKSKFEEMGKEISSKINAIKTTISKGFEAAKSTVTNIVNAIKSAITKGFEEAKSTVTNIVNAIKTAISKGFEAAKSAVTNIVTAIKTVVSSKFGEIAKAVSTKMEEVKKAIQTKLDEAKKFFDATKWLEVGKQMVAGIIKGVTGKASELVTNIKNLASNAVKAAKERLSIHSPSQVFADEIGKNIALGVAEGVRANEKYASESVEKMSSAIMSAAKIKYKELAATNPLTLEQEKQFWLQISTEVQQGTSAYATAMENVKKADEAIIQQKTEFANSIQQQMNLFDQIDQKEQISGAKLLQNMKSQVQSVKSWANNIKELGRRGVSEGLLKYLADMGPQGSVYVSAFTQMTNAQIKQANKVFQQSMKVPQQAAESVKQSYTNAGRNASQGFANGLNPNAANEKAKQLANNSSKTLSNSLQEHSPSRVTMESGKNFAQGFANGISQNMSPITQSVANLESAVRKGIKKLDNQGEWADIGKQLVKGLAKGVTENGSSLVNEIEKLATKAVKAAKKKLKIKSPSRIFADEVGQWIPAGIAQGVENNLTSIDKAMQTASSAAVGSFAGSAAVAGNSQSYTTNMGGLTINVYGQQGQSAQEIAQEVNNIINRQVQQQNMAWGAA